MAAAKRSRQGARRCDVTRAGPQRVRRTPRIRPQPSVQRGDAETAVSAAQLPTPLPGRHAREPHEDAGEMRLVGEARAKRNVHQGPPGRHHQFAGAVPAMRKDISQAACGGSPVEVLKARQKCDRDISSSRARSTEADGVWRGVRRDTPSSGAPARGPGAAARAVGRPARRSRSPGARAQHLRQRPRRPPAGLTPGLDSPPQSRARHWTSSSAISPRLQGGSGLEGAGGRLQRCDPPARDAGAGLGKASAELQARPPFGAALTRLPSPSHRGRCGALPAGRGRPRPRARPQGKTFPASISPHGQTARAVR